MLVAVRTLRFRRLPHTADLRILVWGERDEALIANAVAATVRFALDREPHATAWEWHPVHPWPADLATRLVQTVNEALFLLYARHQVAVAFRSDATGGWLATASLGRRPIHREIKAATFHALRPHRRSAKLAAVLTLDL